MAITSAPYTNTTPVHGRGDSITSLNTGALGHWMFRPGSLRDLLQQAPVSFLPLVSAGFQLVPVGQQGSPLLTRAQRGRRDNTTAFGIGGQKITGDTGMATDVATAIANFPVVKSKGGILILEGGTNDFPDGTVTYGPGSIFRTAYSSLVAQALALEPTLFVICLSIPCRHEVIVGGHFADGTDTWAGNTDIQAVVAANPNNCLYGDIINPAVAFDLVHNPLNNDPGPLTQDSLHPTDLYCSQIIAPVVYGLMSFL